MGQRWKMDLADFACSFATNVYVWREVSFTDRCFLIGSKSRAASRCKSAGNVRICSFCKLAAIILFTITVMVTPT